MEPGEEVSVETMKELRVQIDACINRAKNLADTRPAKGGAYEKSKCDLVCIFS